MEAQSVDALPTGGEWQYEPKWDGFRCLAFKDGARVELRSKAGHSLSRYFPELVGALAALRAETFVLDGEIVVPEGDTLSFDALLQRIHPAKSRVQRLAKETPAMLIVFDLLVDDGRKLLVTMPLAVRRPKLETFVRKYGRSVSARRVIRLSPNTADIRTAKRWLTGRAGLDGVIAKHWHMPYPSGERTGMVKVKRIRTADCVVGGFRYATKGHGIGSLLLGLYDGGGLLHHVGFTSGLSASERKALVPRLERLIQPPGFTGQKPGGPSRWSTARSSEWEPLASKLVVEVAYDHFSSDRFRHGTSLIRWRPDKAPRQCTIDQVEMAGRSAMRILG
jgi:ATP-dependent DNA ligase